MSCKGCLRFPNPNAGFPRLNNALREDHDGSRKCVRGRQMRTKFDAHQKPEAPIGSEERRAHERLHCTSLILFNQADINGGFVSNITVDGMALSAAKPLFDDLSLTVQIQFPDAAEWMDLTGRIIWKNKSKKEVGIRFVGMTENVLQRIQGWIASETPTSPFHSSPNAKPLPCPEDGLARMRGWIFSERPRVETHQKEIAPMPSPAEGAKERLRSWIWPAVSLDNSAFASEMSAEEQQPFSTGTKDKTLLLNLECANAYTAIREQESEADATPDSGAISAEPEKNAAQLAVQPAHRSSWTRPHPNSSGLAPDRRSNPRVRIIPLGYLKLGDSNGGVALNVSETGVAITAAAALERDDLPSISLQFPDIAGWIEAGGQVAWRSPSRKEAGVRFVALAEDARRRIHDWISTQTPPSDLWEIVSQQVAEVPEVQDASIEILACKEPAPLINASSTASESITKQEAALPPSFARDLAVRHAGASVTTPATPAHTGARLISKTLRLRSNRLPVQRPAARLRPAQIGLATLLVLITLLFATWQWILPRGNPLNGWTTWVTAKTIPLNEAVRREETPRATTSPSLPGTRPAEETRLSLRVEPMRDQIEQASSVPAESLHGAALSKPQPPATSNRKLPGNSAPNVFTQRPARKPSWSLVPNVSNHPFARAQQTPSPAPLAPPQLEAQIAQPVSLLKQNAQPAVPAGIDSSASMMRRPASPLSIASAVAILADSYPSLRMTGAGSSKKRSREMSLQLGHLLSHVEPVYPQDAKRQGIQGTVRLHAIIGRNGSVQKLESAAGPPTLVAAAMDAVLQWRYSETLLAGQSVETEEDIAVTFRLFNPSASKK